MRNKLVCECLEVTEAEIVSAIRERGLTTVRQVTVCTGAGGGCNSCHPAIRAYLAREAARAAAPLEAQPA